MEAAKSAKESIINKDCLVERYYRQSNQNKSIDSFSEPLRWLIDKGHVHLLGQKVIRTSKYSRQFQELVILATKCKNQLQVCFGHNQNF